MTQEQIRVDYENEFPKPLSIEWSVPKSRYMPLNEFNADQQIRAIANEYQFGLDTWQAAHARYAGDDSPAGEDKCPITGRPFWGNIEHPERGIVATYGGPLDTFTIPRIADDGELRCESFDQDEGGWVGGETCGWFYREQQEEPVGYADIGKQTRSQLPEGTTRVRNVATGEFKPVGDEGGDFRYCGDEGDPTWNGWMVREIYFENGEPMGHREYAGDGEAVKVLDYGYQKLFWAIAAAVEKTDPGVPRNISVARFKEALLSGDPRPAPAVPDAKIIKLGSFGKAFDAPTDHRAYTYAEQPNNEGAYRLGKSVSEAVKLPAGDWLDSGLRLLKTLEINGFGVFEIDQAMLTASKEGQ